jgi:hypothetical protein
MLPQVRCVRSNEVIARVNLTPIVLRIEAIAGDPRRRISVESRRWSGWKYLAPEGKIHPGASPRMESGFFPMI